jgi:hypothetical protein
MCDNDSIHDILEFQRRAELSRRQFGAMTVGTGLMFMLPRLAGAAEAKESEIEIKTPDGTCDAYFVHPADGKHPGVLIWPDIFGLRPAFRKMATRLAESGYSVLVVNPFYRTKKAPVAAEGASFQDPTVRAALMQLAERLARTLLRLMRRLSSRGSTSNRLSIRRKRWGRWVTAWAVRSRCERLPRFRIVWERVRRSMAVVW